MLPRPYLIIIKHTSLADFCAFIYKISLKYNVLTIRYVSTLLHTVCAELCNIGVSVSLHTQNSNSIVMQY